MKGGKREGAGRPKLQPSQRKVMVSVRLPRKLVRWLRKQDGSQAKIIEKALNQLREK